MTDRQLEKRTTDRFPRQQETRPSRLFEGSHGANLATAIEALYPAFDGAKLSEPLEYCPHCFTENDGHYLVTTRLRELTLHDIALIFAASIYTLGSPADFNYFLPRILEALPYHVHYVEHVLPEKLALGRAAGWTGEQTSAVVLFFEAFAAAVNEAEYNYSFVDELERMLPGLKAVLPELPPGLEVRINDPEAS